MQGIAKLAASDRQELFRNTAQKCMFVMLSTKKIFGFAIL